MARSEFDRRQRRMVWSCVAAAVVLALGAAWLYQRSVRPIRAQEAYDAGERLLRIARYEQAILSLDQAVALKSDFAMAYSLRGTAKMALSKPDEAIPDFARLIALRPDNPEGYLNRGMAYMDTDEFDKALADFDQAAKLDPNLVRAHNLRGVALRRRGDLSAALEAFNRAVQLSPDMSNYFERAATLQLLDKHQQAIADLDRVIQFAPTSAQAYFARAKSYRALGDEAAAERDHHTGRVLDGH